MRGQQIRCDFSVALICCDRFSGRGFRWGGDRAGNTTSGTKVLFNLFC